MRLFPDLAPAAPTAPRALTFTVADDAGQFRQRAVRLKELAYLPLEAREDPDILGKQWAALRGLYHGDVDFIYVAAGLYQPRHVGIVQFYGTSAEAATRAEALAQCAQRMRAVEAVLANFVLSRLADPSAERVRTLLERIRSLPSLLAILGHPDPRRTRRGLGDRSAQAAPDDDLMAQQGEIMLRGLSKLREDFVFLVTARHMERQRLHEALVRMSRVASHYASRQRGALNVGFSVAVPLAAALSQSAQGADARSGAQTESHTAGWGRAASETASLGESRSFGASETQGQSHMQGSAQTQTRSWGRTDSQGATTTESAAWGETETLTQSQAHSQSESETRAESRSRSQQTNRAAGQTRQASLSHTRAEAAADSWTAQTGRVDGVAESVAQAESRGATTGTGAGRAVGRAQSTATHQSATTGQQAHLTGNLGLGLGMKANLGAGAGLSSAATAGQTDAQSASHSQSESEFRSQSETASEARGRIASRSLTQARAEGGSQVRSEAVTQQQGSSVSDVHTTGTALTRGETEARGQQRSWTTGAAQAHAAAWQQGRSEARSQSVAVTEARAESQAQQTADTLSTARTASRQWQQSQGLGWQQQWSEQGARQQGQSAGWTRTLGRGFVGGLSSGLVPGVHIGRSWQTEDDTAMRLTEVARQLTSLLDRASVEGGFMTSALLFVGAQGRRAAASLVPQAFHGPDVPTPVLTRPGDAALRAQALTFRPSLVPEANPFAIDALWTRWSTLLTPSMLAAYTAPNLFEEGVALTFQEKMPPLAFYPELAGAAVCGHQISPETGDLTPVPLRLSQDRHFHTAFCGDTGFGKSVAAERLAYETTRHWRLRTIVLDFGTGWRKMLNAPGLDGHVEIRQLSPGGVRPLRWNPLQIGRHILPEVQWRAFCDVFGQIGQLGQRRQIHELRDALRRVYLGAGALVDDPDVQASDVWGVVRYDEEALLEPVPGTPLARLTPAQRQTLAVHRSRAVGLQELYAHLEETLAARGRKDMMLRTLLEGILFRLHPLVQGAAALQYQADPEGLDLNALVPGDWGVAILEGGSFLDDFSKAFLLGWAAWHLYRDAVAQRLQRAASAPARVQIVFEEANKILAGLQRTGEEGGASVAEQFEAMWRDSRKYGIWLHLLTQTPSAIPAGILSSCNNVFACQLKNPRDRDLIIAGLHRSEKGFVDETWRRFLASLPVGRCVAKLGYAFDRSAVEPAYIQPLLLDAPEPTDAEIEARLGAVRLAAVPASDQGGRP